MYDLKYEAIRSGGNGMFARRKYISGALSVFYPTLASATVDTDRIGELVRGQYFPPTFVPGPAGAQIMTMISEHGHSQITVSQDSIALLVTFSTSWENDGSRGLAYIHERAPLLLQILGEIDPGMSLLYAGAGFTMRLPATKPGSSGWMARMLTGEDGSDSQDTALRTTRSSDEHFYLNTTIGTYREWGANMFSAPHVRLPVGLAVESGVEITEDCNSRLAFNESRDIPVDVDLLKHLVDGAYRAVEEHAQVIEEGERFKL